MDRAQSRIIQAEQNRRRFEPPVIKTVSDIKCVLAQLEPHSRANAKMDDIFITTDMSGTDMDNHNSKFRVSAKTKTSSSRDVLIEGFKIIKQREEMVTTATENIIPVPVNNRDMNPPSIVANDSFMAIDPMINRLLGGYRSGHFIQWDLPDGFTYRYEIFSHRLTRFENERKQ